MLSIRLLVSVRFYVGLGCLCCMVFGMGVMAVRNVSMVPSFFVVASLVMLRGFLVMTRGVLVVLSGQVVVICGFCGHLLLSF
jgi:hypothetical protein